MNDETITTGTTEERAGFCQNCGKPLTKETIRVVGTAVYCEPCLAAKISGVPPVAGTPGATDTAWQWAGTPAGYKPSSGPNPSLAALLGLIPGVGAMYNEQYAKGVVHLVIFAVLVSLSHASDIFGLFVAGWVFYMAIEAHHTARARRDGTPLPNPFGFNDIGERMGFGRNWPNTGASTPPPPPAAGEPLAGAGWGAPVDQQYGAGYSPVPPVPPVPPASSYTNYPTGPAYAAPYTGAYDPGIPAYVPAADPAPKKGRFPAGAIWLIALGAIFLVANTGLFRGVPDSALVGIGLVGLSAWIFVSKMLNSGVSLSDDGSPMYGVRVMRALRGAVWVLLIGVLLLLNAFGVVSWARSWPYFIILAGVMTILERTLYNTVAAQAYAYPPPNPPNSPYPPYPGSPVTETRVQLTPQDQDYRTNTNGSGEGR